MGDPVNASEIIKKDGPVKSYLSTGCTLMDLALADRLPGGFPAGRITQVYGDESTAKTMVAAEALGSAQRQGGDAFLDDVEGTWDDDRAILLHDIKLDDKEKWRTPTSESIEQLFDSHIKSAIEISRELEGKPSCMVIDSLTALSSIAEKKSKMEDGTYGTTRAKQLSTAFRKYIGALSDANLTLIFIDQARDNVGVTFGDTVSTSGGKALKFYASTRILLSYEERIKNTQGRIIGVKLGFFIKKNKVAPPFREGTFRVLFDYGIDDIATSIEWLHFNDPDLMKEVKDKSSDSKANIPWAIPHLKLTARGLDGLAKKVEDGGLEKELAAEVERVWRVVYAPIERKKRVRFGN